MRALCLILAAALAGPEQLQLSAAPPEVRQAITAEPQLKGLQIIELTIARHDLDHDGQEEWLVSAATRDSAGFGQVNRPTWLFARQGARWHKELFLGALLRAEVVPAPGHDAIRALARDGARLHCTLYRWHKGRYEALPCPR